MSPPKRSVILAVIGGMMAVAYLDNQGIADFSFGFQKGGLAEGACMAITGALGGWAILLAFRKIRDILNRNEK